MSRENTIEVVIPEEYITAHVEACSSRSKYKKVLSKKPEGMHKGKGKFTRRRVHGKRACARKLYKECLKLGVEPVLRWSELQAQLEGKK